MKRIPILLVAVLALAGCIPLAVGYAVGKSSGGPGEYKIGPGEGLNDVGFVKRWGCKPMDVYRQSSVYRQEATTGEFFIPQVGWDACELMARNGRPHEIAQEGDSVTWGYRFGTEAQYEVRTVVLQKEGESWIVSSIDGWNGQ